MRIEKRQIIFILALLGLSGAFFLAAVLQGHRLVISGHIFHNDLLFGVDAGRNLAIFTEPGIHNRADMERSNVHPLFSPMVKPWARIVQMAGVTKGTSAIIVNAMASATALLLAAWYLRRRRVERMDTWLLILMMGASATWVCMSPIPGSYMISLNIIILSFILAHWTLTRPDETLPASIRWKREALWYVTGLINYGITVSNGMMSFLAYGFGHRGRKGWRYAVIYGAIVLIVGLLLTAWVGNSVDLLVEKQWYFNDELRKGTPRGMIFIVALTPLLWSFVVPWPTFHELDVVREGFPTITERIAGILKWDFTAVDWVLLLCWAAVLTAALSAAVRDRDPIGRRLSAGLGACLGFHILMHRFYFHAYEGVFFFTPHSLFLVIGLCAPLMLRAGAWPARAKWGLRLFLLVLALALVTRNYHYYDTILRLIPLPIVHG